MNASKENAKRAADALEQVARIIGLAQMDRPTRDAVKDAVHIISDFVQAASRKLPSEAAYARERSKGGNGR